jgi:oligopeptide/dipeptide ABC transporter ATP-binding protein
MYAGRVAEEGPVSRIFRAPRHPYTQKLLGSFPNIRADRRALDTIPGSPPDLLDPPSGCRFHPRCPAVMDVCREVHPAETVFPDGVRVACHLYPPGTDGARLITIEEVLARRAGPTAVPSIRPAADPAAPAVPATETVAAATPATEPAQAAAPATTWSPARDAAAGTAAKDASSADEAVR